MPGTTRVPWIPCPLCEDYLCTIHWMHAHDCPCPAAEDWPPPGPYAPQNRPPGVGKRQRKPATTSKARPSKT